MRTQLQIITLLTLLFAATTTPARAGGGFGSAWTVETTDSSITIDWSNPSGKLRHASSPPKYKICYKEAGAWIGSCSGGEVRYTTQKPYEITGLSSRVPYKIKVYAYTEKKNWRGRWRSPKYRKVATLTQSTEASAPQEPHGNLEFLGGTETSISVRSHWSHPSNFELIRVCYKRTWSLASLNAACKDRSEPPNSWKKSNAMRGWKEVEPAISPASFTFGALSSCRQYKAVAYGFAAGAEFGVEIGGTKGHTGGTCKTDWVDLLVTDHEEVLEDYAAVASRFYGNGPIIEHLIKNHPKLRTAWRILDGDGEDLGQNFTLLQYLTEQRRGVFDAWQAEPELQQSELSLGQFVQTRHPGLYMDLLDEAKDESTAAELDTSGATSVTIVVDDIASATGFGAHVSTSTAMDGFGGTSPECYLRIESNRRRAFAECYDGFLNDDHHANRFRLALGPAADVSHVTFTLSRRLVTVSAVLLAKSPSETENQQAKKTYTVSGAFPLREATGFFQPGGVFYRANGVLSGRQGREGSGFSLADPIVR